MNFFRRAHISSIVTYITLCICLCFFIPMYVYMLSLLDTVEQRQHQYQYTKATTAARIMSGVVLNHHHKLANMFDFEYVPLTIPDLKERFTESPCKVSDEYYSKIASGELTRYETKYSKNEKVKSLACKLLRSLIGKSTITSNFLIDNQGFVPFSVYKGFNTIKPIAGIIENDSHAFSSNLFRKDILTKIKDIHNINTFFKLNEVNYTFVPVFVRGKQWGWYVASYIQDDFMQTRRILFHWIFSPVMMVGILLTLLLSKVKTWPKY